MRLSSWVVRGGLLAALMLSVAPAAAEEKGEGKMWVFIGTYTQRGSKGIYRCELDLATGKLTTPVVAAETASPSFLALHPTGRFLYAVGEISDFGGKKSGALAAFALNPKTGELAALNKESSGGAGPCHVVVDKAGKNVLAANYGGGSCCALPIQADGRLGKASAFVQHTGSSVNPRRQEAPHAHSINLDAANRYAFVADLGLDKVLIYKFDPNQGTLTPNDPPAVSVDPGAGPRHFAFHPSGRYAYVINEISLTVTALAYDASTGALKPVQTISTLPAGARGDNFSTAEVQVHPSGKFVYGSNRGHHSIAAFAVDAETGKLRPVGHATEGIKTPRNFGIDPTGKYLIVANQDGDSLTVFAIDPQTGALTPTGNTVPVPVPVCVKFLAIAR